MDGAALGAHGAAVSSDCRVCHSPTCVRYPQLPDRLFGVAGRWTLLACTNPACGLMQLDPLPDPAQIATFYREYYTHQPSREGLLRRAIRSFRRGYLNVHYAGAHPLTVSDLIGSALSTVPWLRATADSYAMWLPVKPRGRLLELGCGSGERLATLQGLGWQVEGVEPDPRAVQAARARGLDVAEGSFDGPLGFRPGARFDAIVMSHVVEHLRDPIAILQACGDALAEGGSLSILTPNSASLGHAMFGAAWLHLDPPRHLHVFNSQSLAAVAAAAGLRVKRLFSVPRDAAGSLGASRDLRQHGHYRMGAMSKRSRVYGLLLATLEFARMRRHPDCGEELVLIAERESNGTAG